jgi:hypothetical protein
MPKAIKKKPSHKKKVSKVKKTTGKKKHTGVKTGSMKHAGIKTASGLQYKINYEKIGGKKQKIVKVQTEKFTPEQAALEKIYQLENTFPEEILWQVCSQFGFPKLKTIVGLLPKEPGQPGSTFRRVCTAYMMSAGINEETDLSSKYITDTKHLKTTLERGKLNIIFFWPKGLEEDDDKTTYDDLKLQHDENLVKLKQIVHNYGYLAVDDPGSDLLNQFAIYKRGHYPEVGLLKNWTWSESQEVRDKLLAELKALNVPESMQHSVIFAAYLVYLRCCNNPELTTNKSIESVEKIYNSRAVKSKERVYFYDMTFETFVKLMRFVIEKALEIGRGVFCATAPRKRTTFNGACEVEDS